MKTIHLVDTVKVELNFKGRHLYQDYFGHAPERDNFGLTEMQLLDLINMCGGHLSPGAITPISHNYIFMKDSDLENVNDLY